MSMRPRRGGIFFATNDFVAAKVQHAAYFAVTVYIFVLV